MAKHQWVSLGLFHPDISGVLSPYFPNWWLWAHLVALKRHQNFTPYPCEPRKKPSYFPWNTGWLIGILIMVYYNPHITGQYNPLYNLTNQGFFSLLMWGFRINFSFRGVRISLSLINQNPRPRTKTLRYLRNKGLIALQSKRETHGFQKPWS